MNQQPTNALNEGIRHLLACDFAGAVTALQQAIQQAPHEGRAYGFLGMAYARSGDINAGLWALYEAMRLQPNDSAARYNLAVGLVQAQKYAEARTVLEEALALDPNNKRAQAALRSLSTVLTQPPPLMSIQSAAYPGMSLQPDSMPSGDKSGTGGVSGMQYTPSISPMAVSQPLTLGVRVLRGLGWGALIGQWWTLMVSFWAFGWGGSRMGGHSILAIITLTLIFGLFFAIVGSLMGLIIGLRDAMPNIGAIIGVVFGLLMLGVEFLITGSSMILLNIFIWVYTGRALGSSIATRVQKRT